MSPFLLLQVLFHLIQDSFYNKPTYAGFSFWYDLYPSLYSELHICNKQQEQEVGCVIANTELTSGSGEVDVWSDVVNHNPTVSFFGFVATKHMIVPILLNFEL